MGEKDRASSSPAAKGSSGTNFWTLLSASPFSPSSRAYPNRLARGAPAVQPWAHAQESVSAGWPVHRYKQSMIALDPVVSNSGSGGGTVVSHAFVVFGGESYNPAAYLQDAWRFEYSSTVVGVPVPVTGLAAQMHSTPFAGLDWSLPSEQLLPPSPLHRHEPPGGWQQFVPRETVANAMHPLDAQKHAAKLAGFFSFFSSDRNFTSALVLSSSAVLAALLLSVLFGYLYWRRTLARGETEKKSF
jgi:hypothetical protein